MCVGCAWTAQQSVDVGSARDRTMPTLSSDDAKHDPTLEVGIRLSLLGNSCSVPNGAFLLGHVLAERGDLTRSPTVKKVVFRNTALVRTTGGHSVRVARSTASARVHRRAEARPQIMGGADHRGSDASWEVWALRYFEVCCAMARHNTNSANAELDETSCLHVE